MRTRHRPVARCFDYLDRLWSAMLCAPHRRPDPCPVCAAQAARNKKLLVSLSPVQRAVWVLHHRDRMDYHQISEALGIDNETIIKHMTFALLKLQDITNESKQG